MTSRVARASLASVTAASAAAVAALWGAGSASAESRPTFSATASADPVRVVTTLTNFPATPNPVDSGGPSAQVGLDALLGGTAYAAAPDPGSFLASGPALGAGVAGQHGVALPFDVPPYPFAVLADGQNPDRTMGAGGYQLDASVSPDLAAARTTTGGKTPGGNLGLMEADARISVVREVVEAKAISNIEGITVGPLTLTGVRSVASVVDDGAGPVKASSFSVDGARIGTIPVGLDPSGFTVGGNPVPPDVQATLDGVLAAAGVTVQQFPATETADGIAGAGLVVTHRFDAPQFGDSAVSYRIGGVTANVDAAASSAGTEGPAGAGDGGSVPATVGADAVAVPGSLPALTVPDLGTVPDASADPAGGIPVASFVPTTAVGPIRGVDGGFVYLAIALTGLLGLGLTRLLRATG